MIFWKSSEIRGLYHSEDEYYLRCMHECFKTLPSELELGRVFLTHIQGNLVLVSWKMMKKRQQPMLRQLRPWLLVER